MKVQIHLTLKLCLGALLAQNVLGEQIPAPTGEYNVGVQRFAIPFLNEEDPVWPNGIATEYLATLYYPTLDEKPYPEPYLEAELAELYATLWSFNISHLTSTVRLNASYTLEGTGPTLLFGPGGWGPPTDGNYIVISDLVSHGYVVAAFDHIYEQPFLRYPNGTGVYGLSPALNNYTNEWVEKLHATRVKHQLHFIDYFPSLVADLKAPFKTNNYGAFGVSIGGSAALTVALESDAVAAAINVDGTIFGRLNSTSDSDLRKPSIILGFQNHNANTDRTWNNYRAWQTGWWRLLSVDGTTHGDWSDRTIWKLFGTTSPLGPIDGNRMANISRTFIRAFFDKTFLGTEEPLLDIPSADFPEVKWDEVHDGRFEQRLPV